MTELLYLLGAVALIVGLKRLSSPRTARSGNRLAALGMLLAVVVTLVVADIVSWGVVVASLVVGAGIGLYLARTVAMTAMPQMVAALNGLGGIASALVAGGELTLAAEVVELRADVQVSVLFSLAVGAITFTGSLIAFGKLQGILAGLATPHPAVRAAAGIAATGAVALGVVALVSHDPQAFWAVGAVGLLIGVLLVLPVGGADMPVIVSLLNSFSGLAAAGTGFAIENSALIIGGALVGSAGLILTVQMCEAMNRSLLDVMLGAFGTTEETVTTHTGDMQVRRATTTDVAIALAYADRVIIIPGYGLAVAQAQHEVSRLAQILQQRGVDVEYAIHPVAGRMPGHMNVLLAEADVPYEQLVDIDEANGDLVHADVALVIGANDVVNPSARDDMASPIFGMPIIEADRANTVVVKRSLSPGYAGIDNPLFYDGRTMMLFADARDAASEVIAALDSV